VACSSSPKPESTANSSMGSRSAGSARVYLHTLGCPKNEADSRAVGRMLRAAGLPAAGDPEGATHILINTCGFIRDAKEESIEAILSACRGYTDKSVVVFGCLVERYEDELRSGIPEVADWLGIVKPGFERDLKQAIAGTEADDSSGAIRVSGGERKSHAYVKISDGCEEGCTFCSIPAIKGRYRSISTAEIVEEVQVCLEMGARELILVGQDTSRWKNDGITLPGLIDRLCEDDRLRWLRVMYLQPRGVDRRFLEFMASQDRICRYLDVPFQHSHTDILRRMGRHGDGEAFLGLLEEARRLMPDVSIRSTFIVGFPGERERHFEHLVSFIEQARFDYAGGFVYSPEEGTPAARLRPRVSMRTGRKRLNHLHETIERAAQSQHQGLIGTKVEVMIDEIGGGQVIEGAAAIGRMRGQAPDVDGVTHIEGRLPEDVSPGDVVSVRIGATVGWDMIGEFCAP